MSSLAIVPTNREVVPVETRIVPANTESAITPYNRPDTSLALPMGDTPQGAETLRQLAETLSPEKTPSPENLQALKPGKPLNSSTDLVHLARHRIADFLDLLAGKNIPNYRDTDGPITLGSAWSPQKLGGTIDIVNRTTPSEPITLSFPKKVEDDIARVHIVAPDHRTIVDTGTKRTDNSFIFVGSPDRYPHQAMIVAEFSNGRNAHISLAALLRQ